RPQPAGGRRADVREGGASRWPDGHVRGRRGFRLTVRPCVGIRRENEHRPRDGGPRGEGPARRATLHDDRRWRWSRLHDAAVVAEPSSALPIDPILSYVEPTDDLSVLEVQLGVALASSLANRNARGVGRRGKPEGLSRHPV